MRQFDVYANPSASQSQIAPFFIVLSSHHLRELREVVVAPLIRDATDPLSEIDVTVRWLDETLMLAVSELFTLPARQLADHRGSLVDREDDIRRAIDRLFTGF